MQLSEFISRLLEIKDKYGEDLPVYMVTEVEGHQHDEPLGDIAVSVKYRKEGKPVNIPSRVILLNEGFY